MCFHASGHEDLALLRYVSGKQGAGRRTGVVAMCLSARQLLTAIMCFHASGHDDLASSTTTFSSSTGGNGGPSTNHSFSSSSISTTTITTTFTSTTTSLTSSSALSEEQQWTTLSAEFADALDNISLSQFRLLQDQELDGFLNTVSNFGKKAKFRDFHCATSPKLM